MTKFIHDELAQEVL